MIYRIITGFPASDRCLLLCTLSWGCGEEVKRRSPSRLLGLLSTLGWERSQEHLTCSAAVGPHRSRLLVDLPRELANVGC